MLTGTSDKGQQPTEFSTLILLLRTTCMLKAKPNGEISIHNPEPFGVDLLDDLLLAPLEALAGILVQHGEVIAAGYTEAGAVIISSTSVQDSGVAESDVPDAVLPENFMKVNKNDSSNLYSNFVVTTNSYEPKTQGAKASNPHNLRVMEGGEDLWCEFRGPDQYRWVYAL
jgi:hypothetical protein